MKTALILGSTGLTGKHMLDLLLQDPNYDKIILINRRTIGTIAPKVIEVISDMNAVEDLKSFDKIDTIFSCLGTTRKKTPDLNLYRKIEIEYPVAYAKAALSKGLQTFHYISAVGVTPTSKNFYLKIKSEAEEALKMLHIRALHIYQPSLITGMRKERRLGEGVASFLMPFIDRILPEKYKKYHSIEATSLAKGMLRIDNIPTKTAVTYHTYTSIISERLA